MGGDDGEGGGGGGGGGGEEGSGRSVFCISSCSPKEAIKKNFYATV